MEVRGRRTLFKVYILYLMLSELTHVIYKSLCREMCKSEYILL